MAQKETELVIVLRELMSWDMFAPENHFDGDHIINRKNGAGSANDILVPL